MLHVLRYCLFLTKDGSISKIGSHAKKWTRRYLSILSKSGSLHLGIRLNASERPIFFSIFFSFRHFPCVWSRHVRDFLRWDFNEHVGYFSESFSASRFNTFRSASFAHRTCSRTLKHISLFNPPQPHSLPRVPGFSHDKNNEMHSVECSRRTRTYL